MARIRPTTNFSISPAGIDLVGQASHPRFIARWQT
jgi:hypothetical protein